MTLPPGIGRPSINETYEAHPVSPHPDLCSAQVSVMAALRRRRGGCHVATHFRSRMPFIKLQAMLRMGARESRPEYVGLSCQVASGLRRHDEIALEPVARQTRHFIQRSRFFKQMCRCRHNRQLLFAAQLRESGPI
jgi:hypothetical protein